MLHVYVYVYKQTSRAEEKFGGNERLTRTCSIMQERRREMHERRACTNTCARSHALRNVFARFRTRQTRSTTVDVSLMETGDRLTYIREGNVRRVRRRERERGGRSGDLKRERSDGLDS